MGLGDIRATSSDEAFLSGHGGLWWTASVAVEVRRHFVVESEIGYWQFSSHYLEYPDLPDSGRAIDVGLNVLGRADVGPVGMLAGANVSLHLVQGNGSSFDGVRGWDCWRRSMCAWQGGSGCSRRFAST